MGVSGEIKYEYAVRDGLLIKTFLSGYTELSGSLHKFINGGEHNHDQFTYKRFLECLDKLYQVFGITPLNLVIIQLELGFNITPPIPTETLLNGLIEHKGKQFSRVVNSNQHYTQVKRDEYCFKAYDKGLQYKLPKECLRLELKLLRFCRYRTEENSTLHDFILSDKSNIMDRIIKVWDEVTFYDHVSTNKKEIKYASYCYWKYLRERTSPAYIHKQKKRLKHLNSLKGQDVQHEVKKTLREAYFKLAG